VACGSKVIKWRIPVMYLATVFVMTLIIGYMNNMNIWYPLFQLLSGGLLFGAVFMATDPVTSPITKTGQFIYGVCLGLLTVIFRFLTPYPEGVLTSILTMNMLVFMLDKIGVKAKFNIKHTIIPIVILILLVGSLTYYIGVHIKPEAKPVDKNFTINSIQHNGSKTIYNASSKGFHGPIIANVTIDNNQITTIDIISQNETYWDQIVNNNYLNKLITEQNNIQNVDTVSGATISSTALKTMIIKVLEDYQK
jgi:electron transport complex protein RnfD